MEKKLRKATFSLEKRRQSFRHAFRGLGIFFRSQHNAWIQLFFGVLVIIFGCVFHVSLTEWALLLFSIGTVMAAEAFNTAIEIDIDLTSPNYHPYARDTKDVAAGAVLITSIAALVIGLLIFVPKFLSLL